MNQAVRAALELAVTAPAGLLCFLALGEHLRIGKARLILLFLLVLGVWVPLGGWICGRLGWGSNVLLLPSLLVFALILRRLCALSAWKSISVFLGVCGAFSCLANLSSVVDLWVAPDNLSVWFSLPACLAYNGFCWIFVLAMWYPAVHAVRHLLREMEMPGTWYVFWLLPLVLTLLNVVIQPMAIYGPPAGRNLFFFFVVELMLLCLLLLCYLMFYLMARGLGENLRLQQQNQFLQMQTSQYVNLQATIAETRQARHDLRHHFTTIDALLRREEWQELRTYVDAAVESLPDTELNLCENPAADGVAGHYASLLRREGVPAEYILDLPRLLPADEMDVCVVLSNLLEMLWRPVCACLLHYAGSGYAGKFMEMPWYCWRWKTLTPARSWRTRAGSIPPSVRDMVSACSRWAALLQKMAATASSNMTGRCSALRSCSGESTDGEVRSDTMDSRPII